MTAALLVLLSCLAPSPSYGETGFKVERKTIPMKDGVHLSVTLFMPDQQSEKPEKIPALLEYLPYRKDDYMAMRNYDLHSYFAKRGFVSATVDIRGTGSSEGVLPEREYSEQELKDGLEVIRWLAHQEWSNGNVGMFGISWGGFNAIQLAMRRPPQLKAIIAVDASDRLFHDDIHFIDGMMHVDAYCVSMDLQTAISPGPAFSTDDAVLRKRFDQTPWTLLYFSRQRDSDFWKKASLSSNYAAIQIPVFMIGGLLDGYRDSIPRMLEKMKVPMKALIGPWNHSYPHITDIGPAIEWRKDAVRWWNHWLKRTDTGIMKEPPVTVYLRDWYKPELTTKRIPGKWIDLKSWPSKTNPGKTFYLGADHGLSESASDTARHQLKYAPSSGLEAGLWWGDLTPDQRPVDAKSLVYDSTPLKKPMSILGRPKIKLWVSASAPQANWIVRLTDVAPNGESALITGAGLNGAHRISANAPSALKPGKTYPIEIELHLTTWVLPAGHRVRVAVSNSAWPMIFPTAHKMTTSVALGPDTPSRIFIPLLPADATEHPGFSEPEKYEALPGTSSQGSTWPGTWKQSKDTTAQSTTVNWEGSDSTKHPWGTQTDREAMRFDVNDLNPEKSSVKGTASTELKLDDRTLLWDADLLLTSDAKNFYYQFKRRLSEGGKVLREKTWKKTIPRDHQ